jgi:CRP-like cAMP-binding protein
VNNLVNLSEGARASLRDRVLLLRAQATFEGLDDEGLRLLAEHGQTTVYRDGEVIAVEGEPPRSVYAVVEGEIVVTREGKVISVRRAGEAFGGLPVLARELSTLATARGETRTLELPAAAFESALIENYSLLRNTLRALGTSILALRGSLPADPAVPRVVDDGTYDLRPRTMVERLLLLRKSPLGHLNLEALVDFARQMTEVRYPADHLIWSAGDESQYSVHIDAGRVRCTAPDGKSVVVGSGFTFGVLDIWGAGRRAYEARTETPVLAARIDFDRLLTVLEIHPEVGLEMLRGFARDLLAVRR